MNQVLRILACLDYHHEKLNSNDCLWSYISYETEKNIFLLWNIKKSCETMPNVSKINDFKESYLHKMHLHAEYFSVFASFVATQTSIGQASVFICVCIHDLQNRPDYDGLVI